MLRKDEKYQDNDGWTGRYLSTEKKKTNWRIERIDLIHTEWLEYNSGWYGTSIPITQWQVNDSEVTKKGNNGGVNL